MTGRTWVRRSPAGLLTLAMALTPVVPAGAGAPPPTTPAAAPAAAPSAAPSAASGGGTGASDAGPAAGRSFTLVTGDRVLVDDRGGVEVRPAPGREQIGYLLTRDGDDLAVLPRDAAGLVARGVVDPQLFDLTSLAEMGYADPVGADPEAEDPEAEDPEAEDPEAEDPVADGTTPGGSAGALPEEGSSSDLPLIVQHLGEELPAEVGAAASGIETDLGLIEATALAPTKEELPAVWEALVGPPQAARSDGTGTAVSHVWLDAQVQLPVAAETTPDGDVVVDDLLEQMGAVDVRETYDGSGVRLGVVDTGVRRDHPDLSAVSAQRDFFEWDLDPETYQDYEVDDDLDGHGTHVAGIMAGDGTADARYAGVAPGADVVSARVLSGPLNQLSWIIAGMQWVDEQGAQVINMSLGSSELSDGSDPWSLATQAIAEKPDRIVVVAAGNDGPAPTTVSPPAAAPDVLAVGATGGDGRVASFSSRGPLFGSGVVKPDLTGPGVAVTSARAEGTGVGDHDPAGPEGPVDVDYTRLSGTSMAAPAVAGAAALVWQAHPEWTSQQVRSALVSSALPAGDATTFDQGTGQVDVERAIAQTVTTVGPTSFERITWPRQAGEQLRPLTFANSSDEPVTLTLDAETSVVSGDVPADVVGLATRTLVVPAGGTAEVDLVLDDDAVTGGGTVAVAVTGTSGDGQVVRAASGVVLERESYDVALRLTGVDGAPASDVSLVSLVPRGRAYADSEAPNWLVLDGARTVRVPAGDYTVTALVNTWDGESRWWSDEQTLVQLPSVTVSRNSTVRLDARGARPVGHTVAAEGAVAHHQELGARVTTGVEGQRPAIISTVNDHADGPRFSAVPTADGPTTAETVTTYLREDLAVGYTEDEGEYTYPRATGAVYHLAGIGRGGVDPDDLGGPVPDADLARVDARYVRASGEDLTEELPRKYKSAGADLAGIPTTGRPLNVDNPSRRVEFYTADTEVLWTEELRRYWLNYRNDDPVRRSALVTDARAYEAGVSSQTWNAPAAGVVVTDDPSRAGRDGDEVTVDLPLWGDSDPRHLSVGDASFPEVQEYELRSDGEVVTPTYRGADDLVPEPWRAGWSVPDDADRLTLRATGRRTQWFAFGTQVDAEWTFPSTTTSGATPLPLVGVHLQPAVDQDGRLPAERTLRVPFVLTGAAGRGGVEAEVTFDGGATWAAAPVSLGDAATSGAVTVTHPALTAGDGYVGVRVHGTRGGTSFSLTLQRAWALRAATSADPVMAPSALEVGPATGSYGQGARVAVSVVGEGPGTGVVEAVRGGRTIATAPVVRGVSTLTLPASWLPGTYRVGLRYSGDGGTAPATGGVVVTVDRARAALQLAVAPQPVPTGRTGVLTVRVGNSSGAPYTGRAWVAYAGGPHQVVWVRRGVATVTLPARPTGWHRLRVWTDPAHPTVSPVGASVSVPVRR